MSAEQIVQLAIARGIHITTAESCTGGLVSAALTDVPGSSAIFERGFVTYSNLAKHELLDVNHSSLTEYGAVSAQVAAEMAQGALLAAKADIAVSITGIAGPGGSDFKPEGRVWFGICKKNRQPETFLQEFGALGRGNVRISARDYALGLLLSSLHDS